MTTQIKGLFLPSKKANFSPHPHLSTWTILNKQKTRATPTIWPSSWPSWLVSVSTSQAKALQHALKSAASSQQAALPPTWQAEV